MRCLARPVLIQPFYRPSINTSRSHAPFPSRRRPLRIAALAGLVIVFVLVTTGVIALLFTASAVASSSRLEALDGIVALNHDGTTFNEGHDGDLV